MKKSIIAVIATAALATTAMAQNSDFNYSVDRFADIEVLRYQVPGFEDLSLQQKELVYYLTEAALNGRDILFDQNCKYNLMVRQTLEDIYRNYKGDKNDKDCDHGNGYDCFGIHRFTLLSRYLGTVYITLLNNYYTKRRK